jgi:hypothetical protein
MLGVGLRHSKREWEVGTGYVTQNMRWRVGMEQMPTPPVRGRLSLRQNIPRSQINIKLGINPAALPRYIPTNMCLPQGCRDRGNM